MLNSSISWIEQILQERHHVIPSEKLNIYSFSYLIQILTTQTRYVPDKRKFQSVKRFIYVRVRYIWLTWDFADVHWESTHTRLSVLSPPVSLYSSIMRQTITVKLQNRPDCNFSSDVNAQMLTVGERGGGVRLKKWLIPAIKPQL